MLIKLHVVNFRSFVDCVLLFVPQDKMPFSFFAPSDYPRVVGVFGKPNSGKSNLIRAIRLMCDMIVESTSMIDSTWLLNQIQPFQDQSLVSSPTTIGIDFTLNEHIYHYAFTTTNTEILSEYLMVYRKRRWHEILERQNYKGTTSWKCDSSYIRAARRLQKMTRANALFISVAAQFNNELAGRIVTMARGVQCVSALSDRKRWTTETIRHIKRDKNFAAKISFLLSQLDPTITGVRYISNRIEVTRAIGDNPAFATPLSQETFTVKRVFELSSWWLTLLQQQGVLIVDDFGMLPLKQLQLYTDMYKDGKQNTAGSQLLYMSRNNKYYHIAKASGHFVYYLQKNQKQQSLLMA